jgi:SAM-dependent methyltransferase
MQLLYPAYYRFAFGQTSPLGSAFASRIAAWERKRGRRDTPVPREDWEKQYDSGRWEFLQHVEQLGRHSVLAGYLHRLKPAASVLDVGCGGGAFFHCYRPYGYTRYVGVDISSTALAPLGPHGNEATVFVCADAERYTPAGTFDAILFNEALYYFRDPLGTVARYASALDPDGIVMVSTFTASPRAMAIRRLLGARYGVIDETRVSHGPKSWICTVLRPDGADAPDGRAIRGAE